MIFHTKKLSMGIANKIIFVVGTFWVSSLTFEAANQS